MAQFPLKLSDVAKIVGGKCIGESAPIHSVVIDSRVPLEPGVLFVALVGERFDGGDFAEAAWQQGAHAVLISKTHPVAQAPPPEGKALILVDDALVALQTLAGAVRSRFKKPVIAITGSNGKTTVKEMLKAALGQELRVAASPLSWNSQVGVAMTLLQLDFDADIALIECGISRPGEMKRLADMVHPTLGVFVNVGDAHRQTLFDEHTTASEKAQLFANMQSGPVFVPAKEHAAIDALQNVGARVQRVGESDSADVGVAWSDDARTLRCQNVEVQLPDIPAGLRTDAALSVAVALSLNIDAASIKAGFSEWSPAPMRLEMTRTPDGVFLLNDAYSADPESFDVALRSLNNMNNEGRAIAVVGPLAQLGKARAAAHARVGKAVAHANLDRLILVGKDADEIGAAAQQAGLESSKILGADDAVQAAVILDEIVRRGDRVLIKASRPERLERVVELLFSAFGPAVAHINLETLANNMDRVRQIVGPDVAIMPVVKSFGYGLDSVRLGRLFVQRGAEALAVAYADEGVLLRERGITVPIMVQNLLPHELEKIVLHDLSAEVVDPEVVEQLEDVAARHQKTVAIHVKVDTGMGRCGLLPDAALETVRAAMQSPSLRIEGLMTHLASADEDGAEDFTREQLAQFDAFVNASRALGANPRWVHAANTAALLRFPESRYSMVRSGIGLLGYADLPDDNPFEPVLRFTTRVVAVKSLPEGAPVGYGSTWRVPEGAGERRIAVVAVGYNDGYPRHLSNRGWMSVHGVRCPVVGRVCMDVTMLDITRVPQAVEKGDLVVVYGDAEGEPSLGEMAKRADTISYEVLTRISPRVRRIFVGEISGQTAS